MTTRLYIKRNVPFELSDVNVLDANEKELAQISNELGIGLTLDEMKSVKKHFSNMKRNPTDVELQTIGQTWSEHCYHKTFKGDIVTPKGKLIVANMFKEYIAKATRELNLPWYISVFEDNAGIVDFESGYAIAVKVETHNHPSAIDPFGGAATGVGGVIRDILGVWADPIACTDVLGFGPLDYDYDKVPPGTKHPKYLFKGVVAGIGHYGNNMGVPTVNGAIYFDESYVGNVVVYCGCIGILPANKFVRDTRPGDIAVLAGGRTGRDGIHGVTFASAELTEGSEEVSRPAAQIGNPIEEEKLKRAILEIRDNELGSAITDLGGGGLSCATGEMAQRSGCGVHVELDRVSLKYPAMAPWEIYISESQERMLLSVREKNLQKVLNIFESEDTEATPVGRFTEGRTLRVHYRGQKVADLDLHFLFDPPKAIRTARWEKPSGVEPSFAEPSNLTKDLLKILSAPNVASKEPVIRTYDHEVKGNTVLKPLHGKYSGPNDAAVIKPLSNSWKGIVISCGMNPNYGKIDPYWMAASAIDETIRNNVSVGGRRIALLDNFTWGSPERPDRMGSLIRACQACYDFAKAFGTPFISGKDSLYNELRVGPDLSISVTPTLLITAIGIIPDVKRTVSADVKKPGNLIYVIGQTYPELGGSEYYKLRGFTGKTVPRVRKAQARRVVKSIVEAIDSGCVKSCHDLSEGGLAVAAAEMAFSGGHGIRLNLRSVPRARSMRRNDHILFSESNSRLLVEVPEKSREDFEASMGGTVCSVIGRVEKDERLYVYGLDDKRIVNASLSELRDAWKSTFRKWQ
ncbi:MAG: phosphoribosylformylglycinamidine synthase subunit PurL [Candidatus Bathyarchaeota archaeon]|nr:phosphoribosylformylglycinamidine synthase subunit PurL [Candidatus Bathyarchaeota archaeon]MDH5712919.1 phosphoribosylformylglycinamidine synthase subunit PurL [Candidatus Bathyarchaeota archaeon]